MNRCRGELDGRIVMIGDTDLENKRPEPDPHLKLIVAFRTSDIGVLAFVKSILDSEGIEYVVEGEGLRNLFGWDAAGAVCNFILKPAEFLVREADAARAREVLSALDLPP